MIKDYIVLTKFVLSFAVSLSAVLAYVMASGQIGIDTLISYFAVLLVALGVSTLNQVQEYKEDSLMERTKHRPIACGKISPMTGIIIGSVHIILALGLIYWLLGLTGLNLFLFAFIWFAFARKCVIEEKELKCSKQAVTPVWSSPPPLFSNPSKLYRS
jgi:protoheme IX farnesyltransferase